MVSFFIKASAACATTATNPVTFLVSVPKEAVAAADAVDSAVVVDVVAAAVVVAEFATTARNLAIW